MAGFDPAKREAGNVWLFRTDRKPFWIVSLSQSSLASLKKTAISDGSFPGARSPGLK
jgi:hypothetical protein